VYLACTSLTCVLRFLRFVPNVEEVEDRRKIVRPRIEQIVEHSLRLLSPTTPTTTDNSSRNPLIPFPPDDWRANYETIGREFEPLRARHLTLRFNYGYRLPTHAHSSVSQLSVIKVSCSLGLFRSTLSQSPYREPAACEV
jgi:hypothetical protein